MAVDIGAVIAESINRSYSWNTLVESYREKVRARIRDVTDGSLHEAMADPNLRKDPEYRKGYKTGWRASKEGRPHAPEQGGNYGAGYSAGYEASGHANQLVQHHEAGDHDTAADYSMENVHGKHYAQLYGAGKGQNFEDALMRWDSPGRNAAGERTHHQSVKDSVDVINKINQNLDLPDEQHNVRAAPHPADFGPAIVNKLKFHAGLEGGKKKRQAGQEGGQSIEPEGGIDVADERGQRPDELAAGAEGAAQAQADRAARIEHARKTLHNDLETLAFGEDAISKHDAGTEKHPGIEAFRAAQHQGYDPAVHHAHDLWKKGLIEHIRKSKASGEGPLQTMTGIKAGQAGPDSDTAHLQHTGHVEFDPAEALIHSISAPEGFRAKGWKVRAAQAQPGLENFTKARAAKDPTNPKKLTSVHPANGQVEGATNRAVAWLHNQDQYNPEHEMWAYHFGVSDKARQAREKKQAKLALKGQDLSPDDQMLRQEPSAQFKAHGSPSSPRSRETAEKLKAQRAELRGRIYARRKAMEQAFELALKVVAEWLNEYVQIPSDRMPVVIEEIYSRIQANYGVLFEDEEG